MRKSGKKIIAMLMGMVLFFSAVQGDGVLEIQAAGTGTINTLYGSVWTAPNTVKIAQDATDYSDKQEAKLSYQAVRNEYENAQLLVSATKNVSSFELRTAGLTNGTSELSADNFSVYVQKYASISDSYGTCRMPDALLPMETACAYGENTIAAKKNGALWITVYVPQETPEGVYNGTFQLVLNGFFGEKVVDIPVSVEVYDYTISNEPSTKSLFSWRYNEVAVGELDGSIQMMETYYDFFLNYRISLQSLPIETLSADEYIDAIEKYWNQISTYTILETPGAVSTSVYNNEDKLSEQIYAIAKASTSERNLFEKAMIYDIDEPDVSKASVRNSIIAKMERISDTLRTCVNVIRKDESGVYDELRKNADWEKSILDIPQIVTLAEASMEWLLENKETNEAQSLLQAMNCICVKFADDAAMQEISELVKENEMELWWYTCNYPLAPYGNFDIGDDSLLSARTFTWYQDKYDVKGLLYWSASGYTSAVDGEYLNLYENPNRYHTNTAAPAGDGYLTYPGRPYGVYGPLSSLRLMSLRDGQEEYELLQAVRKNMGDVSYEEWMTDFQDALGEGTGNLYQDGENGLDFAALRTRLLQAVSGLEEPVVSEEGNPSKEQNAGIQEEPTGIVSGDTQEDSELLMGFDSYEEITGAGLRLANQFGQTRINSDTEFLSQGTGSWLIKPQGDYGAEGDYPYFRMRCFASSRDTTFRTDDFSAYDKVMLDIYNDSEEEVKIEWTFHVENAFGDSVNSGKQIFVLAPDAWTTCEYDLSGEPFYTALDLTRVKYMTIAFLIKKESKEDSVPDIYLDNLRGHLSGKEYTKKEFDLTFDETISFENEPERYLISDDYTGNNALVLSRVAYKDTDISSNEDAMGAYVLYGEVKGATYPSFTLNYNEQQPAGKIVSFMLYVAAEEMVAEGQTYYIECSGGSVLNEKENLNQWVNVEIELTKDADSSWIFLNFDNGLGNSKFQKKPIQVYLDDFAVLDETKGDDYYVDISKYRTGSIYTHPEKNGYVFAGWYADKSCTKPLKADVKRGSAFAKFVDEDVLSMKFQLKSGTNAASDITDLRLITSVDTLLYKSIGFEISTNGKTKTVTSNTVYSEIYEFVDQESKAKLPTVFSEQSAYFGVFELMNIPERVFGDDFKVTPVWTTLDGTIVKGISRTIKICDNIVDFKYGVTFEKDVEREHFQILNSKASFVNYMDTSIGSQDSAYGTYGMRFESTGIKFPYTKVDLNETCSGNAGRLCFKIYVEADEEFVGDQVFYVGNDDGRAHKFNCWTEGYVKVGDGVETLSFFLNFESAINAKGNTFSITVYMDNFYLTEGDMEEKITFENPAEKYLFWKNNVDYSIEKFDGTTVLTYVVNQNWPYVNFALKKSYGEEKILYFKVYAKVDESLVTDEVFYVGNDDPNACPFNQWTERFIKIKANRNSASVWLNFEEALKTIGMGNITVYLDDFEIR